MPLVIPNATDPIAPLLAPALTARDIDRLVAICADVPGRGDAKHYGLFRNLIRQKRLGSVLFVGVEGGRQIAFMLDLAARHGRVLTVTAHTTVPGGAAIVAEQAAPYLGNASLRVVPCPQTLALREGEPPHDLILAGTSADEAMLASRLCRMLAPDGILVGEDLSVSPDRGNDRALYADRLWVTDKRRLLRAA